MRIDILTLFPGMFRGPFDESVVKRAVERGLADIHLHDIRDYTEDKHRTVDDYPYGGGGGMVLKPEPLFDAVESVLAMAEFADSDVPVILLTPQGRQFDQALAQDLAEKARFILICGHYEGVDERIREHLVSDEISIGDFVLTGGELPAMVVVDAVVRLLPGALGAENGAWTDSYAQGLLEHPHYTRPAEYKGWRVPDVLLSGHHSEIEGWRRRQSIIRTAKRRPDLLDGVELTEDERSALKELGIEMDGPGRLRERGE